MYALYVILIVLYTILLIFYEIGITVAVALDSKGRKIKDRSMWIILTVFFPLICPIIYFAKKKTLVSAASKKCMNCGTIYTEDKFLCPDCKCVEYSLNEIQQDNKQIKKGKIWAKLSAGSLALGIIAFIAVMAITIFSNGAINAGEIRLKKEFPMTHYAYNVDGVETYYDLHGNAYTDADDVLYYDKYENCYKYNPYTGDFIDSKGNKYPLYSINFDADGHFVYLENYDDLEYINDGSMKKSDGKGNEYYSYLITSWDADGNLVDSYTGEPLF